MAVRVLYFAALRERVGLAEESLEVDDGTTVEKLLEALRKRHAALDGLTGYRVAVDQHFRDPGDPVPDGAEVALIPPVAGGCDPRPRAHAQLTRDPIRFEDLDELVGDERAGAHAVFLGVVRNHHKGRQVARMDYEAYEAMAQAELERIAEALLVEFPDACRVALVHRFGTLEIGEASVGVAVSSPHRACAFEASRWGIDAIKETVPIWKKEHYVEGDHTWVRADEMGSREKAPGEPPASD